MFGFTLVVLLLTGCGVASTEPIPTPTAAWTATPPPTATTAPTDMPTPVPTDTPTPAPPDTPAPTPDPGILRLVAPKNVIELWSSWDGKYVLYAHRDAGIQEFGDLDGRDLFVAAINVTFEKVMADAAAFMNAGGIEMNLVLQNNVSSYKPQFFESAEQIGFMVPEVAVECGLDENDSVVRIEFEP